MNLLIYGGCYLLFRTWPSPQQTISGYRLLMVKKQNPLSYGQRSLKRKQQRQYYQRRTETLRFYFNWRRVRLIFSALGFQTQEVLRGKITQTLTIMLLVESFGNNLGEVVITGVGVNEETKELRFYVTKVLMPGKFRKLNRVS